MVDVDLDTLQASGSVKIAGANSSGTETHFVDASPNNELRANDCVNTSGTDTVLSLTVTAQEIKVSTSRLVNRKYVWMEALSTNVKWGFDSNCRFDLFKNQLIIHPVGNVAIYMKMSTGTGTAAIGEGA
jgi:hypothetical protein